jgi:HemY protein
MRAVLWLLGLFAISVALALFAGNNQASVTLFWPPYRVDVSLNLVLLLGLILFGVSHLAFKALGTLLSMPAEARRWRALQRERGMHQGLIEAITHFSSGRFTRARKSAVAAAEKAASLRGTENEPLHRLRVEALAHLYASESAHSLRDPQVREEHWQRAMDLCQNRDLTDLREAAILRSARWLIDDHDAPGCLARLAELPQGAGRRTLALRLKLRAARLDRKTVLALDTARLLAKHKAFSPAASSSILRGLITDLLNGSHDVEQLNGAWVQLDASEKQDPDLALMAAGRFIQFQHLSRSDPSVALGHARECLRPVWENYTALNSEQKIRLATAMEKAQVGLSREWLSSIETAQHMGGHDALLQYMAAHAFADQQLWGKAMQLFQQCAPNLSQPALARRAWLALLHLATMKGDADLERQALERAAHITD